jgi:acetyltransferase-like isoleucine patch superfamily enzyme
MSAMKMIAHRLVPVVRCIASAFYPPKYLRGRYFDEQLIGWKWVLHGLIFQKLLRFNSHVPWPTSPFSRVSAPASNIVFDVDDLLMFNHFGCYFQCIGGRIVIGKGTWIAPNVGLITANHDMSNLEEHVLGGDISLGEKCWIGMNSVILPGVHLGPHTVVGAGSVVTMSFPDGNCVIVGNPARMIKSMNE